MNRLISIFAFTVCIVSASLDVAEGNGPSNGDDGWRAALHGKQIEVQTCDERFYARAFCEQLARDFVAASDVETIAPEYTATTTSDPRLRADIISCIGDDLGGLREIVLSQTGFGRAQGPFSVYRVPAPADAGERERLLLQIRGYAPVGDDVKPGDMYGWSKYALVEPMSCQHRPAMGYYHDQGSTTKVTDYWDGVVRLDGMVLLYSVEELPSTHGKYRIEFDDIAAYQFGERRHPGIVSFIAR